MSLRLIYLHMIEEYAPHIGHADFLRGARAHPPHLPLHGPGVRLAVLQTSRAEPSYRRLQHSLLRTNDNVRADLPLESSSSVLGASAEDRVELRAGANDPA